MACSGLVHSGRIGDDVLAAALCACSGALVDEVAFPSIGCTNREGVKKRLDRHGEKIIERRKYDGENVLTTTAAFIFLTAGDGDVGDGEADGLSSRLV
uniref:Uncharacterized protein n=1 Tax=Oryza punctata TaxID=4537 RepID=A0A0E0LYS1_ORYPU